MAYLNYLASVEYTEMENVRRGAKPTLSPHIVGAVSHLLAYGVKQQPLGKCLNRILDKGEELSPSFWHPLRAPIIHTPGDASQLLSDLRAAIDTLDPQDKSIYECDYEIAEILKVLSDATNNNRCIVSVLEPPADQERAQRVACPFDEPDRLPNFPWGSLAKKRQHSRMHRTA
jgi:hypothetical protein